MVSIADGTIVFLWLVCLGLAVLYYFAPFVAFAPDDTSPHRFGTRSEWWGWFVVIIVSFACMVVFSDWARSSGRLINEWNEAGIFLGVWASLAGGAAAWKRRVFFVRGGWSRNRLLTFTGPRCRIVGAVRGGIGLVSIILALATVNSPSG